MSGTDLPEPSIHLEGGDLGVGTGLLMLLRQALEPAPPGAVVAVRSSDPAAAHDLPAWCRIMAHDYLGAEPAPRGTTHYLRKGPFRPPDPAEAPDWGIRLPLRRGRELHTGDWMVRRVAQVPDVAPTSTGFAPRGAVVEGGRAGLRLRHQREGGGLGGRGRRALRAGDGRPVGRVARHPLAPARAAGAGRLPGDDLPGRERVLGAVRADQVRPAV